MREHAAVDVVNLLEQKFDLSRQYFYTPQQLRALIVEIGQTLELYACGPDVPMQPTSHPDLNQNQLENYLQADGNMCPWCGSHGLDPGKLTLEPEMGVLLPVKCEQCGREWQDQYMLADVVGKDL